MPPRSRLSEVDRFWSKVDQSAGPDGCWLWTGYRLAAGYGIFRRDRHGPAVTAHRFALIASGRVVVRGEVAAHRCDNPPCVNPAHLFVTSQAGNLADMDAKGRRSRPGAKLSIDDAAAIRAQVGSGRLQREIAVEFGVTQTTVGRVLRGEAWRTFGADTPTRIVG